MATKLDQTSVVSVKAFLSSFGLDRNMVKNFMNAHQGISSIFTTSYLFIINNPHICTFLHNLTLGYEIALSLLACGDVRGLKLSPNGPSKVRKD